MEDIAEHKVTVRVASASFKSNQGRDDNDQPHNATLGSYA